MLPTSKCQSSNKLLSKEYLLNVSALCIARQVGTACPHPNAQDSLFQTFKVDGHGQSTVGTHGQISVGVNTRWVRNSPSYLKNISNLSLNRKRENPIEIQWSGSDNVTSHYPQVTAALINSGNGGMLFSFRSLSLR
jgi:hypothetical protein